MSSRTPLIRLTAVALSLLVLSACALFENRSPAMFSFVRT